MFEVYINDILLVKTGFEWRQNEVVKVPDKIKETIMDGEIVIAAHCKNLSGGALIDFGVYTRCSDDDEEWTGKYTCVQPPEGWQHEHFDDQDWESGKAPFGTPADYRVNTRWNTPDIWVRREIQLDPGLLKKTLILNYSHDDEFELFINGIQVVKTGVEWKQNEILEIPDKIRKTVKDGRIVVAAHCKNKRGGALVDFTIYGEDIALQKSVDVQATRTSYVFECGNVELKLDFIAPLLLDDIELMSRPINYVFYKVDSLDGKEHQVEVYFELTPAWASNGSFRTNTSEVYTTDDLMFIKTGRKIQKVFGPGEESARQNWGYFYLCSDKLNTTSAAGNATELRNEFVSTGCLSKDKKYGDPSYLALARSLGRSTRASGKIMVGYDDIYAIQYFGENLRPYWNRTGEKKIEQLFDEANRNYDNLVEKCDAFDHELHQKITSEIGKVYADFLTLNYRQLVTANKIVEGPDGEVLLFSSGQTVAVNHLSSLLLDKNTALLKALLNPIFYYSESNKWEKAYPPSNMGESPLANGEITHPTTPPEEAASNMLILTAAITRQEGNVDYAKQHWEALTKWNNYLAGHITGTYEEAQMPVPGHGNLSDSDRSSITIMGLSSYRYMSKMMTLK